MKLFQAVGLLACLAAAQPFGTHRAAVYESIKRRGQIDDINNSELSSGVVVSQDSDKKNTFFRGDNRDYSIIFSVGFEPKGTDTRPYTHLAGAHDNSGLVSVSKSKAVADKYGGGHYTYAISAFALPQGYDMTMIRPNDKNVQYNQEFASTRPIPASGIMGVWDNNHGGKYIENPNYNPTVYGQSTCSSGGLFGGLFRGLARRADCYVEAPASYKPIKAGQGPTLDTSGANNAKEVGKPQQKSVFTNKPPQVKAGDSSADSSPQTREQAQIQPQQQEPQQQRNNQHCKHGQDCRLPGAEDPTDEPPKKQAGKMAEVAGPGGSQPSPNDGNGGQQAAPVGPQWPRPP
ncbi:hypothetical protein DCS_06074 [Drechmeria coniospora]|uniref:Uncharacterized protein n=1 Tax=Drechmeria coniospora TaxID=98403 RepID=A0A151GAL1_DRECN|nr:hypothetical protein DCS_06074 [Drechmeria coniospora]KYK54117.1 hypothetical protein DCS_06074 [Drechmeria coniospora]